MIMSKNAELADFIGSLKSIARKRPPLLTLRWEIKKISNSPDSNKIFDKFNAS